FGRDIAADNFDVVHHAIRQQRCLVMDYAGEDGAPTPDRTVRPLGLYFWGKVWTLAAWCELRDDFRNFRVDRVRRPRLGEPFESDPAKSLEAFLARVRAT
ncbi:MAG TPA: WYL domain-containing protein, partial [Candidatus Elarobacter sp.]|nr:WYL domain-containing protein [Candidatus Elarobacter sp.]